MTDIFQMDLEELRALCDEGAKQCMQHPLTRRFAMHVAATGDNQIYTAGQVLGERLFRIGGLLMVSTLDPLAVRMGTSSEDPADHLRALLLFAKAALTSSSYLWSEEVRIGLRGSFPVDGSGRMGGLPRHVISPRLLPEPRMWWTHESAIVVAEMNTSGLEMAVDCTCVADLGDRFAVYSIGEIRDGKGTQPFLDYADFTYGSTYPDDYGAVGDGRRVTLESALTMIAFLNSPFIPKERERLTRPERRELQRAQIPGAEDEVSFIVLRRPEDRKRRSETAETAGDWKHRWIVSGHYRAQWYPSEQAHHVIWIAPHLKGPESAPLLEHAYRVAR